MSFEDIVNLSINRPLEPEEFAFFDPVFDSNFSHFENNDSFTRSSFRMETSQYLAGIKALGGVYDYRVVCDTTNNTGAVIDRNEFVASIYIKPARSINFITLNLVATSTSAIIS